MDGLDGRDGTEFIFNLVEGHVGLAVFLHQQEAEGSEHLAIKVPFHEGLLDGVGNGVVGVDVSSNGVGSIASNLGENVSLGGDGEWD
jgi:hypothetical protein